MPDARPPQGSKFFRFDIQNFQNVTALGVHVPPYEVHAPPSYGKSWIRHWDLRRKLSVKAPCGWAKSSDPISAVLKQEVHFQNIERMANGCQQPGFHSFYHGKKSKIHWICCRCFVGRYELQHYRSSAVQLGAFLWACPVKIMLQ